MRIIPGRKLFTASLLSAGLMTWSGCSTENPDGTPTKLGNMEKKIEAGVEKTEEKIKEGARAYGDEAKKDLKIIKDDAKKVGDKTKEVVEEIKDDAKKVGDKVKDAVTPEKKP